MTLNISASDMELKEILVSILNEQKQHYGDFHQFSDKFEEFKKEIARKMEIRTLSAGQERLEKRVEDLIKTYKAITKELNFLGKTIDGLKKQAGGVSRSMTYALEMDAFKKLPDFLKKYHGIDINEPFTRSYVGGEDINIFGKGMRKDQKIIVIGETISKFEDQARLRFLDRKQRAVENNFPETVVIPIIITHFSRPNAFDAAKEHGILVIHSFELED